MPSLMGLLCQLVVFVSNMVKILLVDLVHFLNLLDRSLLFSLVLCSLYDFFHAKTHLLSHNFVELCLRQFIDWRRKVCVWLRGFQVVHSKRTQRPLLVFNLMLKFWLLFDVSDKVLLEVLLLELVKVLPQETDSRCWWSQSLHYETRVCREVLWARRWENWVAGADLMIFLGKFWWLLQVVLTAFADVSDSQLPGNLTSGHVIFVDLISTVSRGCFDICRLHKVELLCPLVLR